MKQPAPLHFFPHAHADALSHAPARPDKPAARTPAWRYRGRNTTFYFPLATSVLISVVLSIVLFLIGRLKR